jgi:hypothetical protein
VWLRLVSTLIRPSWYETNVYGLVDKNKSNPFLLKVTVLDLPGGQSSWTVDVTTVCDIARLKGRIATYLGTDIIDFDLQDIDGVPVDGKPVCLPSLVLRVTDW